MRKVHILMVKRIERSTLIGRFSVVKSPYVMIVSKKSKFWTGVLAAKKVLSVAILKNKSTLTMR